MKKTFECPDCNKFFSASYFDMVGDEYICPFCSWRGIPITVNNNLKHMNYVLPSLFERWLANFIDFIALYIIGFIAIMTLKSFGEIGVALGFIIAFSYIFLKDGLKGGQSFGKRFLNMRVISYENGSECSYFQSIVRNLTHVLWLIDIIFIFSSSYRRLGDRLAKTLVIKYKKY